MSSFMFSPQSEPPDIRNWFSSYEYETPSQDGTSFFDIESCAREQVYGDDGVKATFEKNDVNDRTNDRILEVKEKGFVGPTHTHVNISPQNNSNEFDKRKSPNRCNFHLVEDEKNDHVLQQKLEGDDYNKEMSSKLNDSIRRMTALKNVKGWSDKLENKPCKFISDEGLSSKCIDGSVIAAANVCGSLDNSNNNGVWISTKNIRDISGNENGSRKETWRAKGLGIVELDLKKSSSLGKRDALSDHTNIAPSKWHCPSKNKPNLGPPMKQLRLECWVKRVS